MLISSFNRCDSAKASRRRVKGRERRDGEIGEHVITIRRTNTFHRSKGRESALNDRSNRTRHCSRRAQQSSATRAAPRSDINYGDWKLPAKHMAFPDALRPRNRTCDPVRFLGGPLCLSSISIPYASVVTRISCNLRRYAQQETSYFLIG